jgi:hypothetical protein
MQGEAFCVGGNFGNGTGCAGSGISLGRNGLFINEHSGNWLAIPLTYASDLSGWHHYAIVYNNRTPSLYIDGKFIISGIPSSTHAIYGTLGRETRNNITGGIGSTFVNSWRGFSGDIDDMIYYSRALTPSEVRNLYSTPVSVVWSNGSTGNSIYVTPPQSSRYSVTVTNNITTCTDSVYVTVTKDENYNPFPPNMALGSDSLTLDAGAGYSKYEWNTGAKTQRITVKSIGVYKVTVSNASGCIATDSVIVQNGSDSLRLILPNLSASCTRQVDIPVRVVGFRNLLTLQGSLNWNPADLRLDSISGFGPAQLALNNANFGTSQAGAGRLSFSWNDPSSNGISLNDSTTLFTLRFTVLANSVKSIPVSFAENPTPMEAYDATLLKRTLSLTNGSVSVSCEFTLSGRLITPTDRGVRNTRVTLSGGGSTQTAVTDTAGNYSFKVLSGSYTLTPSKPYEQNKTNGLSTLDLALLQSHILQRAPLDAAYKVIAGDANNSASVTTADILFLRRLILGTDTSLPDNRLWAFVDADQTFTNIANPFPFNATKTFNNLAANVSHTFRGIKIGDVNYDRNPLLDQAPSGDTLRLFTEWTEADDGSLRLKIRARSISALLGYQSALHWEPSLLQFEGVLANPTDIGIGQRWTDEGHLTLSWNDPQARGLTFTDGLLLLEMRFRKVRPFDRTALRLSGEKLATEAFNANFQSVGVRLQSAELKGASWQGSMRVFPNPASREVNVEWRQEKKGTATIRLIDAAGRVVYMNSDEYPAGVNSRRIEMESRFQAGGLTVQVEADGSRRTSKIIVTNRQP